MKNVLVALALLVVACQPVNAGFVDMFNGVTLGSQLPANDLQYMSQPPNPKARLVLIDFWATWCVPCRESIPKFNRLHADFAQRGLEVVGVTKEPREVVLPFLEKISLLYPHALEGSKSLHAALGIKALPYAIFVDGKGKIIWRGQPADITDELITSLLSKQDGT